MQSEKRVKTDYYAPNMVDPEKKMLAPINDTGVDREQLMEEYKTLIKYKLNIYKLDKILQADDEDGTTEELKLMKQKLQERIVLQEEKIKELQENDNYAFDTELILEENISRLAKCYYEKDNKWYHALIVSVDQDSQEAQVNFIYTQEYQTLHTIFIRLLPIPDKDLYRPGYTCEAIYPVDGKFYPCEIEEQTADGKYVVKYKKYNNKETVSLYFLRENKKYVQVGFKKKNFADLNELKIPENLRILPGDSEQEKEKKKKKIKALKQSFKQAQLEEEQKNKQSRWLNFKNQENVNKFHKNKKSIFTSPENIEGKVGVTNSGIGMTKIPDRIKLEKGEKEERD